LKKKEEKQMSSDWLDDDIDDATYAQQMQAREERRIARDLGVHGECC
jgi:hypothetical protein